MIDPFADSIENQPTEPTSAPSEPTLPAVAMAVKPVLTFKGSAGYDAPWLVLHCDSVDDALAVTGSPKLKLLLERVEKVSKAFAVAAPSAGASTAPNGAQAAPQSPQRPNPPGVPVINCTHGPRNYVAKANWAALFCSAPQGTIDSDKCDPLWRDKFGNYKAR